ncbi:CPBP family intramembrane glutamic endopeptidase [Corynebacterium tuscaniense]|uniref:CPBP family intramembrane glutamic endopeptidase n=1 Tax=Corynebacterium tuscaniense TaxID=302449 RepID=UPI0005101266|nr:type II CAAX endopeptidase family protein [Corynebacterium tuscaniense]KGF23127.1 hypothetical protein HMPREF2129_05400 [Corynebacterium tuscaniense DNF00037]
MSTPLATDLARTDPLSIRPQLKDMLVGIAAMLAVYLLLIGSALVLKDVGGGSIRVLMPVLIVLALVIPAIALVSYLKRRGIPLGFRPLGVRGWHLVWQVPVAIVGATVCTSIVGTLLGMDPGGRSDTYGEGSALVLFTLGTYLLIGPFLEEVVFRRLIMGYLDRLMPAAASVLLSSLVFGLAHIAPAAILYTFFAGVSFALVTRWHRSLWAGFILHMCNNVLVQVLVLVGL